MWSECFAISGLELVDKVTLSTSVWTGDQGSVGGERVFDFGDFKGLLYREVCMAEFQEGIVSGKKMCHVRILQVREAIGVSELFCGHVARGSIGQLILVQVNGASLLLYIGTASLG